MTEIAEAGGPSSEKPPKVRLAKGQEVSLGCGTLVLIALIVLIFSNRGGRQDELRALEREIDALRKSVDAQTAEIRRLRDRLPAPAKAGERKDQGKDNDLE